VLKALRRIPPEQVGGVHAGAASTRRARSTASRCRAIAVRRRSRRTRGRDVRGAQAAHRQLALAGTPFYLRHGKRLPKRVTEIAIQFKRAPQMFFPGEERLEANVLAMRISLTKASACGSAPNSPGRQCSYRKST